MAFSDRSTGSALAGLRLPLEGWRFLRRERSLWKLAAVPLLISLAALGIGLGLLVTYAGELYGFASGWTPEFVAHVWYHWLWVAPLKLLFGLLGAVLFAVLAGAILVAAFVLANLVASPFLDALSRRVEEIAAGRVAEAGEGGWLAALREGGRAVLEEARRTGFFLSVQLALVLFGIFVPGGQLVAPPAMTLFTMLFLPLDYASYVLDRRRVSFRERRRWVLHDPPLMLGYGAAAFATCLLPGLNLLAMPVLVVGGTLLVLRHPPLLTQREEAPTASSG